jgi:hypothetical protein
VGNRTPEPMHGRVAPVETCVARSVNRSPTLHSSSTRIASLVHELVEVILRAQELRATSAHLVAIARLDRFEALPRKDRGGAAKAPGFGVASTRATVRCSSAEAATVEPASRPVVR